MYIYIFIFVISHYISMLFLILPLFCIVSYSTFLCRKMLCKIMICFYSSQRNWFTKWWKESNKNPVGVTRQSRDDITFVSFFSRLLPSVKTLILIQPLVTEVVIYTVNASTHACTLARSEIQKWSFNLSLIPGLF